MIEISIKFKGVAHEVGRDINALLFVSGPDVSGVTMPHVSWFSVPSNRGVKPRLEWTQRRTGT